MARSFLHTLQAHTPSQRTAHHAWAVRAARTGSTNIPKRHGIRCEAFGGAAVFFSAGKQLLYVVLGTTDRHHLCYRVKPEQIYRMSGMCEWHGRPGDACWMDRARLLKACHLGRREILGWHIEM